MSRRFVAHRRPRPPHDSTARRTLLRRAQPWGKFAADIRDSTHKGARVWLGKFLMEQASYQDRKLKAAKGAFDASINCGVTFFVTAEVYGAGISGAINSESLLGRFIKERQKEQVEVAIATKFAALPWSNR
ncbi:uncharacterized oxidoreductase At1g06690, chloroplastic-like [Panicum virgatum]|uniref:uncharacterized oxidoreductase At1g06690, chloroplastic-like n=1 Tax=Panicum virgatum TaxID=38727 RepID=UPI0019D507D7|nr:uncharacterized oxidoreductase At1g06690, chloroplastic-like [Panicum virgatum]